MDPKVNGQLQKDWTWLLAAYLFLGGVGGGAYTIAALNGLVGDPAGLTTTVGLWIGFPALAIGSGCLLADLGTPARAVLAGMKPGTSWIARGFWIISIFMVLSFLHLVLFLASDEPGAFAVVSIPGIIFAIGLMAYTGILLGASKGIPFWRSGVVPALFVVSALVTGHFTIMLFVALFGSAELAPAALYRDAGVAAALVVVEVLAILFFLQAAYKLPDPRESAERILANRGFVIGYFAFGLGTPLLFMLIMYFGMDPSSGGALSGIGALGALLGLVGGLILRWAILVSGALPTLNVAGFKFRRIARPKATPPEIGMLPPQ